MNKRAICRVLLLSLVISAAMTGSGCGRKEEITQIPPTCTENGYTIYTKNGLTDFRDIVPATGHSFGDWITVSEPTYSQAGKQERVCSTCRHVESEFLYQKSELSQIRFEGDLTGISKTSAIAVRASFVGNGVNYHGYATIKHQGHGTMKYEKKNYTVKFYQNNTSSGRYEFQFSDWNPEYKFILKANYQDVSRSRALICADIWSEMVSSRDSVHQRLSQTSNYGAIDGFPVEVYLNGEFLGLYNLTLHKDNDLYSMQDGRKDCIMIANTGSTPSGLFCEQIDWESDLQDWEVEYCGIEDTACFQKKLNDFIAFVNHSSDEEFKSSLSDYADVESLIDYLIATYALGLHYNHSRDMVLICYDDGPWIASLFGTGSAFGMREGEIGFLDASEGLPAFDGQAWTCGNEHVLWNRMVNLFYNEICDRYQSLRKTTLSEQNLAARIKARTEAIPPSANAADLALYPEQPLGDVAHPEQMAQYVKERLSRLDLLFSQQQQGE